MKKYLLTATLLLLSNAARAQTAPTVLAASATSSAPGSAPITCLLDSGCNGFWSPGSKDSGTDEGIYVQFESPIPAGFVEVDVEKNDKSDNLVWRLYVNGKTQGKNGPYVLSNSGGSDAAVSTFLSGSGIMSAPIEDNVKSVFIKLEDNGGTPASAIKIKKIKFFQKNAAGQGPGASITPVLPQAVPATLSATSVLEPTTAYHPANLFDSKYDFAWSTDGKTTDGKGQSVTIGLASPQTISGMMVWNGYQRSDSHFKANGRVSELEVKSGSGAGQKIALKDQMGMQKVTFPQALPATSQLTLTITGIYPGQQYKDVLISELRLLDQAGKMLIPVAKAPNAAAPAGFQDMAGKSYASILHQPLYGPNVIPDTPEFTLSPICDNNRIRLREDGSFVIYKDFNYGKKDSQQKPANVNANVMEGNWEPKADKVRIFGRKYVTALKQSEYLQAAAPAAPQVAIFQSELTVKPYSQMTPQDKQALYTYLWTKKKGPANHAQKFMWVLGVNKWDGTEQNTKANVEAANYDELVKKLDAIFTELNPVYLSSSVLTDLLMPTDQTNECWSEK